MSRWVASATALICLGCLLAACGQPSPAGEEAGEADLLDTAAAEATAIIQQAQATALMLQAQAQATALLSQAGAPAATPSSSAAAPDLILSQMTSTPDQAATLAGAPSPEPLAVRVLDVSFAAEGAMIMVRFMAPPHEAEKWWPGNVSVVDEASGTVYNEIPVMPTIGPLIGRPKIEGQPGYVMLVNPPPGLRTGALVTVVLGAYRFEHVPVK
jgi:hypothetical protein